VLAYLYAEKNTSYSFKCSNLCKMNIYMLNGQVSGNLTWTVCASKLLKTNCLSAIRFRGGVILQVSCYTLLMRIPTYMATVLLSAPHGTPFRFIGRLEQIRLSPAYLESVRLNPSSPVLLTRNGPLRIFDTLNTFVVKLLFFFKKKKKK